MSAEKISVTLESELLAEARQVAGVRALSRYVNRALRNQLQHDRHAALLSELERDNPPIEERVIEEVRAAWPSPRPRGSRILAGF
jgi:hypothetical protein